MPVRVIGSFASSMARSGYGGKRRPIDACRAAPGAVTLIIKQRGAKPELLA
jgi:hypothetical protein